ncbi:hypothetical protein C8R44DRAFT_868865 [Mycena epipterygia]|nr:hypothetical protein C8R44DRAFT_868865 [Mycena epipterygia]
MRLMDHDAWKVKDAPSVIEGVNLLKNQQVIVEAIGPLDGQVAAHFEMGRTSYFVTTNTRYVPLMPQIDPKQIIVRRDMRYGPDDPVLWPHRYVENFCHLAAIPKAPTSVRGQQELGVMWWNPTRDDFVCPASGLTLTRGLGRLSHARFSNFSIHVHALIDEYEQYVRSLPTGTTPIPLFPQLVQTLHLSLEHLRIPATYTRMQLGVVAVQREFLELTGMLRYMTKYKPRMEGIEDPNANTAHPDNSMGCFTDDPHLAQLFWKACLPCWLIRPLKVFSDEIILRVVVPFAATDFLEMNPAAGFSPVAATDRLDDRLRLLHRCTQNMPWYRNPFEAASPSVASTSVAETSRVGRVEQKVSAPPSGKGSPYAAARAQAKAQKEAKGPNPNAKVPRDKFLPIERLEMPTTITSWATALAAIDRSRPPACGIDVPQRYVLPEPALLASPEDEPRRRMLYHHYRLVCDALIFRLADPDLPCALLSTQEWRDVLQGKVTKQGRAGTRAQARSASLEELLLPAFKACGINALTEFPVPPEAVPPMHVHSVKELLWELAEMNFRYEFLALDVRASGLDRPDECRRCFAGEGLIGLDFRESQRGLAALGAMNRLPYLLCTARIMRDWSVPCERPKEIDTAKGRTEWDSDAVRLLEQKVALYYTQSFYDLFGRAAVVPMRLEHEIGS